MDTVRSVGSKVFGAGLIVSPTRNPQPTVVVGEEGGEVGEGEGGVGASVEELQRQLRQVMKEKEQLKQSNTAMQKNVVELQKQVSTLYLCLHEPAFQLISAFSANIFQTKLTEFIFLSLSLSIFPAE